MSCVSVKTSKCEGGENEGKRRTEVNRIRVMILIMPTKRRKDHPHIRPRDRHPRNVALDVPKQRLLQDRHVVQVPRVFRVRIERVRFECWHRAVSRHHEKSSVKHRYHGKDMN